MDELQQCLLKGGQSIPGVRNHDPGDLALKAVVTADSWTESGSPWNVINGKMRATDGEDYAWVSDKPLPQNLVFTLREPSRISQVRVTLDMPFARYTMGYHKMPAKDETLADFMVEVCVDGTWNCVGSAKNNFQRLVVFDFAPVTASAVRIRAFRATAVEQAVIVEVRIY